MEGEKTQNFSSSSLSLHESGKENSPASAASEPEASLFWIYLGAGLGGVALAILMFAAVAFLYFRTWKREFRHVLTNKEVKDFMNGISEKSTTAHQGSDATKPLTFPYDKSYEVVKETLKTRQDAILGTGQFCSVLVATIEDKKGSKSEVALKTAKPSCPKPALLDLLSEIKILIFLGKHPNLVSIEGAYTAELQNGTLFLATELCPLGSLKNYLRKNKPCMSDLRYVNPPAMTPNFYENMEKFGFAPGPEITHFDMIRWSHEIASGMEYLGEKNLVYGGLSAKNVLLVADKTAKITNFGLSQKLHDKNYVKKHQDTLPWRWMAVESLKNMKFTAGSDVWSYGVTLWEIFSLGDLPYPGVSWSPVFVKFLENGLRMKSPPYATPELIMVSCWHKDPGERPTFAYLKLSMRRAVLSVTGNAYQSW